MTASSEPTPADARDRQAIEHVLGRSLDQAWPMGALAPGSRVTVMRDPEWDGPWPVEFPGTIDAMGAPELNQASKARSGELTYWVTFDTPQYDSDGDGPYRKAQVWGRYLRAEPAMTSTAPPGQDVPGDQRIKVWFRFVPREGWLPQDTEALWGTRLGDDTARVENVAFLQDGIAEGDVVRFVTDDDGLHWARERISASGNGVVRVLPVPGGPLGRDARSVHRHLAPFGMGGEVFSDEFPLVAFNVPAEADLGQIKKVLARGQEDGWWHFEVGCVTDGWREA